VEVLNIERLVRMANDIGRFFQAEPDHATAVEGVASHLKRFWDPRMRKEIVTYAQGGGAGLLDLVREAVMQLEKH
jgi:formate dehydrogenase subunit delta